MERSCLASRYKRRELVGYFTDVINSCAEVTVKNTKCRKRIARNSRTICNLCPSTAFYAEIYFIRDTIDENHDYLTLSAENLDKQDVCERIVISALRYHNITMMENGSVCLLGKFHNVLYVAAKLCYDWDIDNNEIVSRLLNDIFYCEKTFERLLVGAIFGTRVTHFLSGWKCDFDDRKDNIRALVYFLNHAISGRLEYRCESSLIKRRFIDVPMESYGQVLPLRVTVQHGAPDILLIMLRYGASVESDKLAPSPIEIILTKLSEFETRPDQKEIVYPEHLATCLKLLLRTVTTVCVRTPDHIANHIGILSVSLYEQYPNLANQNLIPPERSGVCPAELKHLCRCRIREILHTNWALPRGIKSLQIPGSLRNYLDLLQD